MFWVGIMVSSQPFYIAGIEDDQHVKRSAFGAMGMFIFSLAASIYGIYYHEKHRRVADIEEELQNYDRMLRMPEGMSNYRVNVEMSSGESFTLT